MKNNQKYKKRIVIVLAVIAMLVYLFVGASCSSCERWGKSCTSNVSGGLERIVTVYDYQGDVIAKHEGKIDVQINQSKVLFDLNGKRYVYYNCLVEIIEK